MRAASATTSLPERLMRSTRACGKERSWPKRMPMRFMVDPLRSIDGSAQDAGEPEIISRRKPTPGSENSLRGKGLRRRGGRAAPDPPVHPGDVSLADVADQARLLEAVRLPRIDDHLDRHAAAVQRVVELVALGDRHPHVRLAVL